MQRALVIRHCRPAEEPPDYDTQRCPEFFQQTLEVLMRGSGVLGKRIRIACLLPSGALTRFGGLSDVAAFCIIRDTSGTSQANEEDGWATGRILPAARPFSHGLGTRQISDDANVIFRVAKVSVNRAIYSFDGFQMGFRFSAKALRPSRAFSPDCRGWLYRSMVS